MNYFVPTTAHFLNHFLTKGIVGRMDMGDVGFCCFGDYFVCLHPWSQFSFKNNPPSLSVHVVFQSSSECEHVTKRIRIARPLGHRDWLRRVPASGDRPITGKELDTLLFLQLLGERSSLGAGPVASRVQTLRCQGPLAAT